jgi:hypothetical protein
MVCTLVKLIHPEKQQICSKVKFIRQGGKTSAAL